MTKNSWGSEFTLVYQRVVSFIEKVFGAQAANDPLERADRFLEEAIELHQAVYASRGKAFEGLQRANLIKDFVWVKPPGEEDQEIAGAFNTLMSLHNCVATSSLEDLIFEELKKVESTSSVILASKLNKKNAYRISRYKGVSTAEGLTTIKTFD